MIGPLRKLLDMLLAGTRRSTRVAKNQGIGDDDWTMERCLAWDESRVTLEDAVMLVYPMAR